MAPEVVAALVSAGAFSTGQAANMYATGKLNKKNRLWQEKMYSLQRQHDS